ncbi:MAG: metallophosphoesterase family protein [Candidatus Omnitrophota bacterium]|nr:MAG: metallophosphoesterase family protein [Candidatus Omnitrophota bacterium]
MKIGIISDTHIPTPEDLPDEVLKALADTDLILHAGDLVSLAILARLKEIGPEVKAVWGNMDPPEVKRALPEKQLIQIKEFRIGLTHGSGAPTGLVEKVKEKFKGERIDCIVYGHSHSPANEIHENILYFNPGSPTDKVFAPYNSYGILEIDKKITGKIIKLTG